MTFSFPSAPRGEIRTASLQFVPKLSGFNKPSKINEAEFNRAVEDVGSFEDLVSDRQKNQVVRRVYTLMGRGVTPRPTLRVVDDSPVETGGEIRDGGRFGPVTRLVPVSF